MLYLYQSVFTVSRGFKMDRKQLVAELKEMGIEVKGGMVKKSAIEAALRVLAAPKTSEEQSLKPTFASIKDSGKTFNYAFAVPGVDPKFHTYSFGRQLNDRKVIEQWLATAKQTHVGAKHKNGMSSVKDWVKLNKPKEFYAKWREDGEWKDDSIEIFYKHEDSGSKMEGYEIRF